MPFSDFRKSKTDTKPSTENPETHLGPSATNQTKRRIYWNGPHHGRTPLRPNSPTAPETKKCLKCGADKNPYDGETLCRRCLGTHDINRKHQNGLAANLIKEPLWYARR